MNINGGVQCNIHNKFDIEVIDGNTGELKQKAEAYNMVLDNLWHYIIETTTAFGTYIQYGSGTGTIQSSDTSLFTRYSGKSVTQDALTCDYVNKVITRRVYINLPLTEAVGVNITEVGLAAGGGNGTLTTHAMLQDMNGNPISIAKTEFDIINIYATIYCHWSITDVDTEFYPMSGLHNALTGASNIFGSFTGGFGSCNWYGNTNNNYTNTAMTWTKTTGSLVNKQITYTMPRANQSTANVIGGIQYILGSGNFDGVGIKQGNNSWNAFTIQNESVGTGDGVTTKFKTKYSFPYNATVYINGVAQATGVTVLNKSVFGTAYLIGLGVESTENNLIKNPGCNGMPTPAAGNILYNPYYLEDGITNLYTGSPSTIAVTWSVSNDLTNWVQIGSRSGYGVSFAVPAEYQHYKYFKISWYFSSYGGNTASSITSTYDGYNIIFDIPPADGDVITIDYDTNCIPKDEDHVLDATITFTFGDYIPTP